MGSLTRLWGLALAALVALLGLILLFKRTDGEKTPPAIAPAPSVQRPASATPAEGGDPLPKPISESPSDEASGTLLPTDSSSLERFQAANSAAMETFLAEGMPYPVAAARAVREAIRTAGHDPDATIAAWLDPAFAESVRATDPYGATATLRTIENLLQLALGATASEEQRRLIWSEFPDELRAAAAGHLTP